jgi:Do/DeqQ family serine protease
MCYKNMNMNMNMTPTTRTIENNTSSSPKPWWKSIWLIITQIIAAFFLFYGLISWLNEKQHILPKTITSLLNPLFNTIALPKLGAQKTAPPQGPMLPEVPQIKSTVHLGDSYRQTAQKSLPLVVNITTIKTGEDISVNSLFDYLFKSLPDGEGNSSKKRFKDIPYGLGSGVIMREDGYIMTNFHVIAGADQIDVTFHNGKKAKATLIGADKETDLALLKVNESQLPKIQINQDVAVGDIVLAIGNPFGVGQTLTSGIISALGRNELGINTFENFIQTDAAINPGNSGGALVDVQGRLVGINTAIFSKNGGWQGIGFAIPADAVLEIMNDLLKEGRVLRGYLGVSPQDLTPAIRDILGKNVEGALIAGVLDGSPANQAGLEKGDIIISIDQKPIANSQQLLNMVAKYKPNTSIECVVLRKQETLKIKVTLGTRPAPNSDKSNEAIE